MDSLVDGVTSLPMVHPLITTPGCNSSSMHGIKHHQHPSSTNVHESSLSASNLGAFDGGTKLTHNPAGSTIVSIQTHKASHDHVKKDTLPDLMKHKLKLDEATEESQDAADDLDLTIEISSAKPILKSVTQSAIKHNENGFEHGSTNGMLESVDFTSLPGSKETNGAVNSQSGTRFCPSPQYSCYSAAPYTEPKQSVSNTEPKQSVSNTEVSECASSVEKSADNGEVSNTSDCVESQKLSVCRVSTSSEISDESSSSSLNSAMSRPHMANDTRWEAIQAVKSHYGTLEMKHFKLLKKLGRGDIGSVYLSELAGTKSCFAMKVMDKVDLAGRKKLVRVQTEREILQSLDHPFLPTLYTHFETERFSCLVMEYCPGGDLHAIRQRQPGKFFSEHAARFYVAEILLAMEYLHMLGIIYRDLKPENVLVREDGHIMLSDFDLSLRCVVSPTLVRSANSNMESKNSSGFCVQPACIEPSCIIQPTCFSPRLFGKNKKNKKIKQRTDVYNPGNPLPELLAEPTSARSMSFVGTHEYLAPEIIKGEGHGSAVDWWTLGIFLYELLFGRTPFKGAGNRATLFNVVGQPLRFPDAPSVSFAARDLIRGLLVKEPQNRLAYRRGATEIKQHPFFQSVNWALIRCASPPDVPKPVAMHDLPSTVSKAHEASSNYLEIDFF